MRIEAIRLKNFRAFADVDLRDIPAFDRAVQSLGPPAAMAGPEGTGGDMASSFLADARLVGFSTITDVERAKSFYIQKLGCELIGDDEYALVLRANGSMLRLGKSKAHQPLQGTVLGWNVPDVERAVDVLEEVGVRCEHYGLPFQDARGIATFPNGDQVAWFKDPDGNVLSVANVRKT